MTIDERQRQVDFILEQQASISVKLDRAAEKLEESANMLKKHIFDDQSHDKDITELIKAQTRTDQRLAETDERLNTLINVVERYFEDRNGKQ